MVFVVFVVFAVFLGRFDLLYRDWQVSFLIYSHFARDQASLLAK
jgi:hypothetical protein